MAPTALLSCVMYIYISTNSLIRLQIWCQRLMSRWKYQLSYNCWIHGSWAQPVFRWLKPSGECCCRAIVRTLKSSIWSSTSFQLDKTFWGVGSAAVDQSRRIANRVVQGDWKFSSLGWPQNPSKTQALNIRVLGKFIAWLHWSLAWDWLITFSLKTLRYENGWMVMMYLSTEKIIRMREECWEKAPRKRAWKKKTIAMSFPIFN